MGVVLTAQWHKHLFGGCPRGPHGPLVRRQRKFRPRGERQRLGTASRKYRGQRRGQFRVSHAGAGAGAGADVGPDTQPRPPTGLCPGQSRRGHRGRSFLQYQLKGAAATGRRQRRPRVAAAPQHRLCSNQQAVRHVLGKHRPKKLVEPHHGAVGRVRPHGHGSTTHRHTKQLTPQRGQGSTFCGQRIQYTVRNAGIVAHSPRRGRVHTCHEHLPKAQNAGSHQLSVGAQKRVHRFRVVRPAHPGLIHWNVAIHCTRLVF